jgi:type II secretion system protein N
MLLRSGLFVVAFVIGLVLLAPLDKWLLPRIRGPIEEAGAELRLDGLRFALPAGVRATGLGIDSTDAGIAIDSLYVGIFRDFDASACGGRIRGKAARDALVLDLSGVDLSRCLRIGKIELESTLDGNVTLTGVDVTKPADVSHASAKIDVASEGGIFRGVLPHAGSGGQDLPLGEWEFSDLVLRATYANGELVVDDGHTLTSGVRWEVVGATIPPSRTASGLSVDFRAKQVEDTPRSRALIGLMPKTTPDAGGWHNYRVTGSLRSPRVVAVR